MVKILLNGKVIVVSVDEFVRLCKKKVRLRVLGKVDNTPLK